jgi:hypothetical protein
LWEAADSARHAPYVEARPALACAHSFRTGAGAKRIAVPETQRGFEIQVLLVLEYRLANRFFPEIQFGYFGTPTGVGQETNLGSGKMSTGGSVRMSVKGMFVW